MLINIIQKANFVRDKTRGVLTLANFLTFLRIVISPIFMLLYLGAPMLGISQLMLGLILLALLIVAETTDVLDGYFARKFHQVTQLGKLLDPMADSIYRIAIFLAFTKPPVQLPLFLVFLFLYRDTVISTLRTICALKGFALAARVTGKIKAVIQAIAAFVIVFLLIFQAVDWVSLKVLQWSSLAVVVVAVCYSLFSGVEYLFANREYILCLLKDDK